jgi:hypothetical protein
MLSFGLLPLFQSRSGEGRGKSGQWIGNFRNLKDEHRLSTPPPPSGFSGMVFRDVYSVST